MSSYNTTVDPDHIFELRKFRYDNGMMLFDMPVRNAPATDQEIRDLLLFAAPFAQRDLALPRNLEALRVIRLVPEKVGAALFEGVPL